MPNTTDFILRLKGDKESLVFMEKFFKGENKVLKFKAPIFRTEFLKEDILEVRGLSHYYMEYATVCQPVSASFQSYSRERKEEVTPNFGWPIYHALMIKLARKKNVFNIKGKPENPSLEKLNALRHELIWAFEEEPLTKENPLKVIEDADFRNEISSILDSDLEESGKFTSFKFRKHVLNHGFPKPEEFEKTFENQGEIFVNLQSLCWALNLHAEMHGLEPNNGFEEFLTIFPNKMGKLYHETIEVMEGTESKLIDKFTI